ncbi:MAG: helix-turn-helix transcriptional regulator [Eubacteriales bacterium]|jgi:DNA-binding CsgD family transcriptional regulator
MMDNFSLYDDMLYALYTASDFSEMKTALLEHMKQLIPHNYASILLFDKKAEGKPLKVTEFFCEPSEFMEAEKKYLENFPDDISKRIALNGDNAAVRTSSLQPDRERLQTRVYRECYRNFMIYDMLQVLIRSGEDTIALMTLFRTHEMGLFTDEDVYLLRALSRHLNTVFYKYCRQQDNAATVSTAVSEITSRVHMTPKETEILTMIFLAKSNPEICDELGIKEHTLQKHLQNIYRKLNISSRWELLRFSVDAGTPVIVGRAG